MVQKMLLHLGRDVLGRRIRAFGHDQNQSRKRVR
jgi:hypothetical protein